MKQLVEKEPEKRTSFSFNRTSRSGTATYIDNRASTVRDNELIKTIHNSPKVIQQLQMVDWINNSPRVQRAEQLVSGMQNHSDVQLKPIQRKSNRTGLPDQLKSGIENLSGYSMDDVRVHYNSGKPAQLQAHAYAQGTDIHLAPGQEKHLPHEAWHVVQQKQGRVQPTLQFKIGLAINDDTRLEREADIMGMRANSNVSVEKKGANVSNNPNLTQSFSHLPIQLKGNCVGNLITWFKRQYISPRHNLEMITGRISNADRNDYLDLDANLKKPLEAAKKHIDAIPSIWVYMENTPKETALSEDVLGMLVNAFIISEDATYEGLGEYTNRENFGVEGGCEKISIIWAYLINRIEGQNIAEPILKFSSSKNYHVAVMIEGYGEVDASYRQFYENAGKLEEEVKKLPIAIAMDELPDSQDKYGQIIKKMFEDE